MSGNHPTNVFAAFEMLLEEVETEIDLINRAGAQAFAARNYESAREALERAGQLTAFRDKVATLRGEWETLAAVPVADVENAETARNERRNLGRLQRGMRTTEAAYYLPVLNALIELGGSARVNDVLARVEQKMRGVLKQVDYEPLASEPDHPRWRNTAQWARHELVQKGLMKKGSPHGVWEITEAGKAFAQRNR